MKKLFLVTTLMYVGNTADLKTVTKHIAAEYEEYAYGVAYKDWLEHNQENPFIGISVLELNIPEMLDLIEDCA